MMNKWFANNTNGGARIVATADGSTVATIIRTSKGTPGEKMQNARLIASAPELQEEARKLRATLDAISTLSGRCSDGHGADCKCGYCLIHDWALDTLKHEQA